MKNLIKKLNKKFLLWLFEKTKNDLPYLLDSESYRSDIYSVSSYSELTFQTWLLNWKPIHLCWLFEKFGLPIPKYLVGKTTTSTSSSSSSTKSTSSSSSSVSTTSSSSSTSTVSTTTSSSTVAISWNNYLFATGQGSFGERIRGQTFGH